MLELSRTKTTILLKCSFKDLQNILLAENTLSNRTEKDYANILLIRSVKEHYSKFTKTRAKIRFVANGYGQFKGLEISPKNKLIPAKKVFAILKKAGVK